MSLPLAFAAALALLATPVLAQAQSAAGTPVTAPAAAVNPLAREALYADIVRRAGGLRAQVEAYRKAPASVPADLSGLKGEVDALSALDMQGHVDLAKRGTDGDLKCILKGISEDLPKKLAQLQAAADPAGRAAALEDLYYLLRDNVEVITTPPSVHS
jgi:hypothetical protein